MPTIEQILDKHDVDWGINEDTGCHLVNADDYSADLMVNVSMGTRIPMTSINYGMFYALCPHTSTKRIHKIMESHGYKIYESNDRLSTRRKRNSVIVEVAEYLSSEKLFKQFAKAMKVLGQQMGMGPIQDKLKERGISWKIGDDGESLIFYVKNDVTGNPQPVARISKESIGNQNDFQKHLEMMIDMANGDPPGTMAQKQQKMQDNKAMIGDIARVVFPSDNSSQVANQMLSDK